MFKHQKLIEITFQNEVFFITFQKQTMQGFINALMAQFRTYSFSYLQKQNFYQISYDETLTIVCKMVKHFFIYFYTASLLPFDKKNPET